MRKFVACRLTTFLFHAPFHAIECRVIVMKQVSKVTSV